MRTWTWLSALAAMALGIGCVEGGGRAPVWVCPVIDYEILEDVGCTCDLPPGAEIPDREVLETGTFAAVVAPPGTYRANASVRIVHEGVVTTARTLHDGSLFVGLRHAGVDLRGTHVRIEVEGGPSGWATLDAVEEARLAPSRTPHQEFPAGAIVIEHPTDTLWTRAHIEPYAGATEIEHALWITSWPTWLEHAPRLDSSFERMDSGSEGESVQLVMLHASGNASGCYPSGGGRCMCSVSKRAASLCADQAPPDPPEMERDAGVPF